MSAFTLALPLRYSGMTITILMLAALHVLRSTNPRATNA